MDTKETIKFSTIFKRSQCLNTLNESTKIDSNKVYDNLLSVLSKSKTGRESSVQYALKSYIESMCYTENINSGYRQILSLIEKFNDLDPYISDNIISEFTNRVLPYMEAPILVSNSINNYNLEAYQVDNINNAVSKYTVADRIINNHNILSKRFNLDNAVNKYRAVGLKYFVDSCADMIDTFKIPNYQKLNIALEESNYILEKNGIKEDKSNIAKYVIEYFLTSSNGVTSADIDNYKNTLLKSYILEESDLSKVRYLFKDTKATSVESIINRFLVSGDRSSESINNCISDILDKTSKEDIIYNIDKAISVMWDLVKNEACDSDDYIYDTKDIITEYVSSITLEDNTDNDFTRDDISTIIENIDNLNNMIRIAGNSNLNYSKQATTFLNNYITPCIESLSDIKDILYSEANISTIKYLNSNTESVPLNEFKVFKFHNLVRAAFNLDKFLKVKEKKFYTKTKNKVNKITKKAKSVLFGEGYTLDNRVSFLEDNMIDYIGEDNKADICIRQYLYEDNELEDLTEFVESVCGEYNDVLLSQDDTCRVYYIINPGLAEIRIKESVSVEDINEDAIYKNLDPATKNYIKMVDDVDNALNTIEGINIKPLHDLISDTLSGVKEFSLEQFTLALEAMSILGTDKDIVKFFGNKFNDYHFNNLLTNGNINESYLKLAAQERKVNSLVEEYTILEEANWEDKLNAYYLLNSIMEYSFPSYNADDYDDEDDDDEDNKKKSNTPDKKDEKKKEENKSGLPDMTKKSEEKPSKIMEKERKEIDAMKNTKPDKIPKGGGLNLASIKLALNGLKEKVKAFDTKQKEISRNVDETSRVLLKSMKDALISDRREAIIKGSVIPSMSRCFKASLALVVIGYINLPAAIAVAVGGFAMSKKLTKQERLLLLDEIETELEVVDKELAIADSNNEINKYRALLQYKKDLQRQYQRIKYNIRVGKDILPNSATGVPSNN
jgi:hypothetical protein